jgi:hypothetical protein
VYFITRFLITKYNRFDHKTIEGKSHIHEVELSGNIPRDNFPERIQKKLDIHGKINQQMLKDDGIQETEFLKPGATVVLSLSADLKRGIIEIKHIIYMNRLHFITGCTNRVED